MAEHRPQEKIICRTLGKNTCFIRTVFVFSPVISPERRERNREDESFILQVVMQTSLRIVCALRFVLASSTEHDPYFLVLKNRNEK